jgi:dTDP-4-dehydrorhamnose reductase
MVQRHLDYPITRNEIFLVTTKCDFLVIAADGLVGNTIFRYLNQRKLVVGTSRRLSSEFTYYKIDCDNTKLDILLEKLKPNGLVINCSAILDKAKSEIHTPQIEAIVVNSLFPNMLAMSCQKLGLRMLHISTNAVFGSGVESFTEDSRASPNSIYGLTKLLGEVRLGQALTMRTSLIGPSLGAAKHGLWDWIKQANKNEVLGGYVNQIWTGVTTLQIASISEILHDTEIFERILRQGAVHHLCPNDPISKYDLIAKIAKIIRPDLIIEPVNSEFSSGPILISNKNAMNHLMKPANWDQRIKEMMDWTMALQA